MDSYSDNNLAIMHQCLWPYSVKSLWQWCKKIIDAQLITIKSGEKKEVKGKSGEATCSNLIHFQNVTVHCLKMKCESVENRSTGVMKDFTC